MTASAPFASHRLLWSVAALICGALMTSPAYGQSGMLNPPPIEGSEKLVSGALSVDELLSIASGVGGTPLWSPDGSRLMYPGGGKLLEIPAAGGSPIEVLDALGEAGHFLTPQHARYSPDGQWISFISDRNGTPEMWIASRSGERIQLTNLGASELNSYSWAPDGHAIAFAASRYGTFDVWTVSVPDGEVRRLTSDPLYEVYPTWTPDSEHVVFVRLDERWVDHEVIATPTSGRSQRSIVLDQDFFDYGYGRTFGYPQVSPDGRHVMFRSHRSGWINYWLVPWEGGDPVQVAAEEADQSDARWSPDGRHVAFTSNHNGTHQLRVATPASGTVHTVVRPDMGVVANPEWSPDGHLLSYTLTTPTAPRDLFVVEWQSGEIRRLTQSVDDRRLLEPLVVPEKVFYESTDGLTIPAYLYRPADHREGARYPGIMWIHGGPTSQFHDTFEQHVQFIVQEGFVVLLPNIRGSSGFGKAFEKLNEQCWGHCDLEDVLAGVDYLKTLPYVNPERMGIHGSSYGGIMSMAAVAFAPGVFHASIPHGGYADWIDFYHGENELRHIQLLNHDLGHFEDHEDVWRRSSSIYSVDAVTTPIFIIHGEGRYPVYRQSEDFAHALQRHNKTFRYKTYPGENYYVSSRANRRQMLLDMLEFFDQYLRDDVVDLSPGG